MPLDETYFVWLYSQVGSVDSRNRARTYWELLKVLHRKQFQWPRKIVEDGNRAQDGKDLRNEFIQKTGVRVDHPEWLQFDCSMLELMVALAWHLEFEGGGKQKDWFWVLIDNLGLSDYTDANISERGVDHINAVLEAVIDRQYDYNGTGGFFPLNDPERDQRDVELWYQLNAYLLERL